MIPYKYENGIAWYDIREAVSVLNNKKIGRNIFLEHLREINILDANNYPTEKYKTSFLLDKISVVTRTGFYTKKVLISNLGLEYFKANHIYEKISNHEKIYLESLGSKS